MPWMDANGISIHFELAGHGSSVVLLHEMGGTLDSWDGIAPALSKHFRTLRYDQRGSGLSEKVRQPIATEILVEDLEAVLQGSGVDAPYHFVTVAAATMQALIYMSRHPDRIASFVFCNPFTGADPSRVAALEERAGLAEREGLRKAIPVTLDKSWPGDIGDRAAYTAYRGRYLAHDPVCFAAMNRSIVRPKCDASRQRHPSADHGGRRPLRPGAPTGRQRAVRADNSRCAVRIDRRRAHDAGAGAGCAARAAAGLFGRAGCVDDPATRRLKERGQS